MSEVKVITNRHRAMMDALVLGGLTSSEVALKFGITESRLSILRRSPMWKMEEEALRKDNMKSYHYQMAAMVPLAMQAYLDVVKPATVVSVDDIEVKTIVNSPHDRVTAANAICKLAGLDPAIVVAAKIENEIGLTPVAEGLLNEYLKGIGEPDLKSQESLEDTDDTTEEG